MASLINWLGEFFGELKRRRVIRAVTIYVIAFWPVIQIVDILSPALSLPDSTMRYLLMGFVGFFPVVLILAWIYDLNKGGLSRTSESAGQQPAIPFVGRGVELAVITVLLVVISALFAFQYRQQSELTVPDVQIQSIAVLPMVTFSDDREDGYFADGLTEELLNVLSRISHLRVAARTSSFAYKNVSKNVQDIGRELNVKFILEGSVRRNDVDNTIRVTAQLIEVSTGAHRWSQTFDKKYRDIFKIQDEIASAVVNELKVTLLGGEENRLRSRSSVNPAALVAYSMGQTEQAKRTRQGLTRAIGYYQKAVKEDDSHVEAYAGLADTHALLAHYEEENKEERLQLAKDAVERAFALDDQLGAVWTTLGLIHSTEGKMDLARQDLQKSMRLSPSNALANMRYGLLVDNPDERIQFLEKAFELDPGSPVIGYNLANEYLERGRESETMMIFSKIVEADPFYPGAYLLIARINEFRGRLDEAVKYYRRVYDLEAGPSAALDLAEVYVDLGEFIRAEVWLEKAKLSTNTTLAIGVKWMQMGALAASGKEEEAREQLTQLIEGVTDDYEALFHSTRAAYHLQDYEKVLASYRRLSTKQDFGKDGNQRVEEKTEIELAVAMALKKLGRNEESIRLLNELDKLLTKVTANGRRVNPDLWFTLARVKLLLEKENMALIFMQRAIDEGWRQSWRPFVDPAFDSVRESEQFLSMMERLNAKLGLMREQIAFDEQLESDWIGS